MTNILKALGVDWPILISQTANFFLLLVILQYLLYRPLMRIIKRRNETIKQGLRDAEDAKEMLRGARQRADRELADAQDEGLELVRQARKRAHDLELGLRAEAEEERRRLSAQMQERRQRELEEARLLAARHGAELVKRFLVKSVELDPKAVDRALIERAIHEAQR